MATSSSYRARRVAAFLGFSATVAAAIVVAAPSAPAGGHMDNLIALNFKFLGAATCGSSACHGGGDTNTPPKKIGSEFSVWQAKDFHAKAASNLAKPKLDKNPWMSTIGSKLGLSGDLSKADRCMVCHSSNVPAALQGDKFDAAEGVSCYQCHGPAEKWLTAHANKTWYPEQVAKMDHDALLKTTGFFDTKPVAPRAEMCASCHLAIDEKLVLAGHPQPIFEQLTYQTQEPEHWIERNAGFGRLNLWAAGQVVGMKESIAQLASRTDAALVASGKQQAMAHLLMVQALVDAAVVPGDAAKVKALSAQVDAAAAGGFGPAATAAADLATPLLAAIDKLDPAGDQAKTVATLKKLAAIPPADLNKAGRHGVEQEFFALERLLLAYRDGAKVATADFKPVRDTLAPLRTLKLYDTRFDPKAPDPALLAKVLPAVAAKVDGLK